jgi:hypothetical protein
MQYVVLNKKLMFVTYIHVCTYGGLDLGDAYQVIYKYQNRFQCSYPKSFPCVLFRNVVSTKLC